jgi:hypothetical protein
MKSFSKCSPSLMNLDSLSIYFCVMPDFISHRHKYQKYLKDMHTKNRFSGNITKYSYQIFWMLSVLYFFFQNSGNKYLLLLISINFQTVTACSRIQFCHYPHLVLSLQFLHIIPKQPGTYTMYLLSWSPGTPLNI